MSSWSSSDACGASGLQKLPSASPSLRPSMCGLLLTENLFPVDYDYQMMKCMVEVLGQPEDHLLRAGKYTQCFFSEEEAADGPT